MEGLYKNDFEFMEDNLCLKKYLTKIDVRW